MGNRQDAMRLMALDIGQKRIGIATSDSGIFATPHSVLYRKSKKKDFARLGRLIKELDIERLVIGMPYSLNSNQLMGPQARRVKRYADALAETLTVPIDFCDESYSTVDAEKYLAQGGRTQTPIDAAAAAVILQKYLDDSNPPLAPPLPPPVEA